MYKEDSWANPRMHGGAGPRKCQDPFSQKNHNPRMARRKRIEAIARTEREKRQAEEDLTEEIKQNTTSVTYENQEFVTPKFALDDWNKSTRRRFARWIESWSSLSRPWQRIVDIDTNEDFQAIKGKSLVLLHPDEDWHNGQVVLKYKPKKSCPWRGIRDQPVRIKIGERAGCVHNGEVKSGFVGRIVRLPVVDVHGLRDLGEIAIRTSQPSHFATTPPSPSSEATLRLSRRARLSTTFSFRAWAPSPS
jgi:hypothetical protein